MDDGPRSGRLLHSDDELRALLARTRTIAVLGIKTEAQRSAPAHYVPAYLADVGFEVIPVPVYFPEVTTILGRPVYRTLQAVPQPIDLVNVFRRAVDLAAHLADIVAARPRAVWMQLGIAHAAVARHLTEAGIDVVQDRCLLVDHRRLQAGPRG